MKRVVSILAVGLMAAASCGDAAPTSDAGVRVAATTTILGDVARNVVGTAGTVEVILPLGADPHDYQPSSRQVAAVREADLVVANGLDLEEGLADVLDGANVALVAPRVDPLGDDPHVWMDPLRMAEAARLLAADLARIEPTGSWAERADAYASQLQDADREIRAILESLPSDRRRLVTNHDALGYFADRYDFEVIGVVIPGGATLAEPSSAELAALVAEIERSGVPAIFAETTEPTTLAEAVAAEVGAEIAVVELFVGSLGEPGSGAETLIDMLLTDARLIAAALR